MGPLLVTKGQYHLTISSETRKHSVALMKTQVVSGISRILEWSLKFSSVCVGEILVGIMNRQKQQRINMNLEDSKLAHAYCPHPYSIMIISSSPTIVNGLTRANPKLLTGAGSKLWQLYERDRMRRRKHLRLGIWIMKKKLFLNFQLSAFLFAVFSTRKHNLLKRLI